MPHSSTCVLGPAAGPRLGVLYWTRGGACSAPTASIKIKTHSHPPIHQYDRYVTPGTKGQPEAPPQVKSRGDHSCTGPDIPRGKSRPTTHPGGNRERRCSGVSSTCHLAQGSKEQRNPALLLDFDDSCRDDIPCVERILQRNSCCLHVVDMYLPLCILQRNSCRLHLVDMHLPLCTAFWPLNGSRDRGLAMMPPPDKGPNSGRLDAPTQKEVISSGSGPNTRKQQVASPQL